jgi:NTP pyrophosphatase (non-canonical NTP hydrolase)
MDKDHVKTRLHDAMHRGKHKATEEELAEVTLVVLAIVGELAAETALVLTELEGRITALESRT